MNKKLANAFWVLSLWCFFALSVTGCSMFSKGSGTDLQQTPTAQIEPETRIKTTPVELKEEKIEAVQPHDDYVHTVRWHGETLSYIAKWYTGQFRNWKVLAKANPTLNPDRIHKGNQIVIPEGVLKTRSPLPKNFVATLTPQKTDKKTPARPSSQPEEEKAIPLFGPKEH